VNTVCHLLHAGGIAFLCRFEIKGLNGEALKSVLTITLQHHKQPVDSELVSASSSLVGEDHGFSNPQKLLSYPFNCPFSVLCWTSVM
jgi:hypothetical protein